MFFNSDYKDLMPPAPESDEASLDKNGLPRFRDVLGLQCGALLKVNLLFLLSCVPIVTIPISLFTMNRLSYQMVLDRPLQDWGEAFRDNWKLSWQVFLLTALPLAASGYGMWTYLSWTALTPLFLLPFAVCSTIFLVTLLSSGCLYGLLAGGRDLKTSLRLAVMLGVAKPLRTVPAALCGCGLPLLAVLFLPLSGLYLILIGFSIPCMLEHFFLRTLLRPYIDEQG